MTETDDDDDDDSNNGYASVPLFFLVFLVSLWCLSVCPEKRSLTVFQNGDASPIFLVDFLLFVRCFVSS